MDISKSWVYVDYTNDIWRFSINGVNELQYSIMHNEGEWTKENLIDRDVTGYYIYADKVGINIIYGNTQSELKYCTFIDKQWKGKTLYVLKEKEVKIKNINVILIENEINIFYLLIDKESNDHGIIMQYKWNDIEAKVFKLHDLVLTPGLKENYLVYLNEDSIEMVFFSDEGNEISLNYCIYKNSSWTNAIRLYGIYGNDIEIKMLKDQYGLHLINKYKENSMNHLVHVLVKKGGDLHKFSLHESKDDLTELILLKEQNKPVICWIEEKRIYFSFFEGGEWSSPICIIEKGELDIKRYNYIKYDEDGNETGEVYGIGEIELKLIIPGEDPEIKEQLNYIENENYKIITNEKFLWNMDVNKVKIELNKLKSENKTMEQTIATLNVKLKNSQKIQEEYKEQISKITNYKQKAEDNYNVFMEVQNKLQNELTEIKKLYEEEITNRENLEIKLKDSEEEKTSMEELVYKLKKENDNLNKEIEAEKKKTFGKGFWKF